MPNTHAWLRLNVIDYTRSDETIIYPTATFHPTWTTEHHRCGCHTRLCTRPATQEDFLCDECRGHPDCQIAIDY